MKCEKDYYKILNVKPNAAPEEIKKAYRRLAAFNHPDKNPDSQAAVQMQEINEAYSVLGDQRKRIKYDFEHGNSTPISQATSPSHNANKITTTSPQSFFAEEENPLEFRFRYMAILFALLFIVLILTVFSSILGFSWDLFPVVLLIMMLGSVPVTGIIILSELFKSSTREKQCPKCGTPQAAEKMHEKLLGIFQKSGGPSRGGEDYFFTYEKYKIHYKCKYCSYEWFYTKAVRQ